jgi:hypothetical protein
MTMVSSGQRSNLKVAMKSFSDVQNYRVKNEPDILRPWTWFDRTYPNRDPLWEWLKEFSKECTPAICSTNSDYRFELDYARLRRAKASQTDFSGASLYVTDFRDADLSFSKYVKAYIEDADFTNADLTEADFSFALISNADFSHANLAFARLNDTDLSDSVLSHADLSNAKILDTDVDSTDFSYSNLAGADLTAAQNLIKANLKGATYTANTKFPKCFEPERVGMIRVD